MRRMRIIRTTRDIVNPQKDRRSKDWHKQKIIEIRTRLIVCSSDTKIEVEDIPNVMRDFSIDKVGQRYAHCHRDVWLEKENKSLFKLIMENHENVEPVSVYEHAAVAGIEWHEVNYLLIDMWEAGLITPSTFVEIAMRRDREEAA